MRGESIGRVGLGCFVTSFLVVIVAAPSLAMTFFVRPDGGTARQCTGLTDARYPGVGWHRPCAWSHPFWALQTHEGNATWKLRAGDTLIIAKGSYRMGFGAPNTGWCSRYYPWDCGLPPLPSGLDPEHPTRILGKGWNHGCASPPELWGAERAWQVLDLTGTSDAVLDCLEITDHSSCVYAHANSETRCKRDCYPFGTYADVGIYAADSSRVVLRHLNIHGLASGGIHAGRLTDWTVENVRIAANGWVGWDGDLWDADSSNQGMLTFRHWLVEWNGCAETYPGKKPEHCWGQSAGGYGDGVGTAQTGGRWIIEDSIFRYNTSDGLDLLYVSQGHIPDTSVEIRRTISQGNAGNQIKVNGTTKIENSLMAGNCGYFYEKSFAREMGGRYSGDHCRAGGGALVLSLTGGDQVSVVNSTIVGEGDVLIGVECDRLSSCNGADAVILANNILAGYGDFLQPGDQTCFVWVDNESSPPFPGSVIGDHNLGFNVKFNGSFPQENDPHIMVADPMFVNAQLDSFNGHLQAGGPAIDSGLPVGGLAGLIPNHDLESISRPGGNGTERGAYEFGSK
jgi:hypothetical protein